MNKKCCRSQEELEELENRLLPKFRLGPFVSVSLVRICTAFLVLCS